MPAELEGLASIQEVSVQQNKEEKEDEEAKDEDEETNGGDGRRRGIQLLVHTICWSCSFSNSHIYFMHVKDLEC